MLKALELFGFKSFADRTRFEFPEGITVVVGPNGSGKSNVVDAVKWVLGEQSARSLRGGEMVDVIFKGADASGRKPANTAEATLIFDNRDHQLGVDAEEVHVTRRVYRSGEGEYLINKRACRLRDIRDVFRGTGMGRDAYSLIEQGKVDTLLQASPRDRRAIFEEAAGISRFKAKKLEAQRRLERVEQNLLRLSDIVEELEGRLRTLRAQASKARRYQEYTERLQQLRNQAGLADYRSLGEQLDAAELGCDEARRIASRLGAECEALEARQLELDTEKEMGDENLRVMQAGVATLRQEIATWQARVHGQLQRAEELQQEKLRIGRRYLHFFQNAGTASQQLNDARAQLHQAEQARTELELSVERGRTQLEVYQKNTEDAQLALDSLRESHVAHLQSVSEAESQTLYGQRQQQELELAHGRAGDRQAELVNSRQQAHAALQLARSDEERAVVAQQESVQALEESRHQLEEIQQRLAQAQEALAARRLALQGLQERASVLEDLEQRQDGVHDGTRALLSRAAAENAATKGPYADILGMVADLLHVDVDMAQLIDVALDEKSQYLVVQGDALLQAVIDGTCSCDGRVGFVPVPRSATHEQPDRISLDHAAPPWPRHDVWDAGEAGVLGPASNFVEAAVCPQLVSILLGNTWFAETLADAWRMTQSGHTGRWVTRDGHICEANRVITLGGFRDRYQIVSRRSQLRQLETDVELERNAIDSLQAQCNTLFAQRRSMTADVEERQATFDETRTNLQRIRWTVQQGEQQVQAAEAAVEASQQDLVRLEQQVEEARAQFALRQDELDRLRQQMTAVASQLAQAEQRVQQLSAQRDAENLVFSQLSVELARWQQTVAHRQDHLARWEREGTERATVEADLAEQSRHIHSLLSETERSLLTASTELAEGFLRLDSEERKVCDARRSLRELTDSRREVTQHCTHVRRDRQRVEDDLQRKQLEVQRCRQQKEALVARFQEDFDVNLAALAGASGPFTEVGDVSYVEHDVEREIAELRRKIANIGAVNMEALQDLQALESRYEELAGQYGDLQSAKDSLQRIIHKINADSKRIFAETLQHIRTNFQAMFRKVFGGGEADIVMDDSDDDVLERGIEIVATPPGKQSLRLSLLSGGERALTAVTLLLAIFQYRPSPFCILDEVDGPLDEANIGRFISVLQEFLDHTKFVIVTHSKVTMTSANTLYGITMQESGVSKQVSVRFEDVRDGGEIAPEALQRNKSEDAA